MNSSQNKTVYQQILDIAHEHGVSYEKSGVHNFAEAVTNLSDNDLDYNDATRALISLQKAQVLTNKEAHAFLFRLMDEMGIE